jgi:hypothetical protein
MSASLRDPQKSTDASTSPTTLAFPFGRDGCSTLIVCRNEVHQRLVINALQIKAMYVSSWQAALLGHQFDKIIVFTPNEVMWHTEAAAYKRWCEEYIPTKLTSSGRIHFI